MKMVGNAVTVGVSRWIGERLSKPGHVDANTGAPLPDGTPWPSAAWGDADARFAAAFSEYPRHDTYRHLTDVMDVAAAPALTHRGAAGFLSRTRRAKLHFDPAFLADVEEHVWLTDPGRALAEAG
jgi:DNA (cytosine-5)-methyltransferase 1